MRTTLRRIIALTAVSVFAAVAVASPTALAHDRKHGKHSHKYERDRGKHGKYRKPRLRSYVELNRQVDLLTKQLAALGQSPDSGELAALKAAVEAMNADVQALSASVTSMNSQYSSTMGQLKTRVDQLETRVLALEAGGGSGATGPALYDGNENRVGNVISVDQNGSAPWVAFKEGDHFFALKAVSDQRGFTTNPNRLAGTVVRFTEAGCKGQAYLDPYDNNTLMSPPLAPFALALAGVNDNHGMGHLPQNGGVAPVVHIYVAPAKAPAESLMQLSMIDSDGFCTSSNGGFFATGVRAVTTLEAEFVAPYTVK